MAFYATFISNKPSLVDYVALRAAVIAITGDNTTNVFNLGDGWKGKKNSIWTQNEIDQVTTAINNAILLTAINRQQQAIDNMSVTDKAIILTILDQFNLIRSKLSPSLGAITIPQMIQAVRDKAGSL